MFLFFEDSPETSFNADDVTANLGTKKFGEEIVNSLKSALDPGRFQTFFIKLEDQAIKTSRSLAGSIKGYSDLLQDQMYSVYKDTIAIGGSTKDVVDFAESFASATGRIPAIQNDIVISAIKISKEFGISTKEVAAMAGEFAKVGLGQEKSIETIRNIGNTARKYGVNAQTLTKTVQENLKKSNAFTFKDGIKGLTEMAAKAQKLGISMESAFSTYEAFLDPDKAIEMGTEISMLGGSFAKAFGDPIKNMNMSVEEVQENFIKAAQEAAVFNAETGQFEIPKEQQKAILAFANKMNIDMQQFASTALQGAKNTKVLSEITNKGLLSGVSDEDKELVASFTELGAGGEMKVTLPGGKEKLLINLDSSDIESFKKAAKTDEKSVSDMTIGNDRLISVAEDQNATLKQIRDAIILSNKGRSLGATSLTLANTATGLGDKVVDEIKEEPRLTNEITAIKNTLEAFNGVIDDFITDPVNGLSVTLDNLITTMTNAATPISSDMFIPVQDSLNTKNTKTGNVITGPKGSFLTIPEDEILTAPNISEYLNASSDAFNTLKLTKEQLKNYADPFKNMARGSLQNNIQSPAPKLQDLITTTNSNINITGGANVSGSVDVKVTGSGLNLEDSKLSAMISSKVSAAIEERLSKRWGEKQGNIKTV